MPYDLLIVDDSAITRMVLKRTINMAEVPVSNCFEAENGAAALEVLRQHSVDLVMTDINMPEMNGMEMAAAILGNPATCNVPVVVISTHSEDSRIHELRSQGIKAYVHKPFTPEDIRNVISDILQLDCV